MLLAPRTEQTFPASRSRDVEPGRPAPTSGHDRLLAANQGRDVHLVGGPRTIDTFRAIGALDQLELIVLPLLFGAGMRLTPALSPDTGLTFERERALPGGSVEIVYALSRRASGLPTGDAGWSPASQRLNLT